MLVQFATSRRKVRTFRLAALTTVSVLALIIFVPKPPAYASPVRLGMTAACFCIAAGGLALCIRSARNANDAKLAFRYHGASNTLRTTAAYIKDEQRGARRGILPALVAALGFIGLDVLAAWPQCAALAPIRDCFSPCAAASLATAALIPFWQRKRIINGLYLRQSLLRLQAQHIGFKPRTNADARRMKAELKRPAVSSVTATGFRAGGYDWKVVDDLMKNTLVWGMPGSGKTLTILNSMLEGLLATSILSGLPASGLIIDPKGDFKSKIIELAGKYGRGDDLAIFSAEHWEAYGGTTKAIRFNLFDTIDDSLEIAAQWVTAAQLSGAIKVGTDTFFIEAASSFIRHALDLVRSGRKDEPPAPRDIRRLATEKAESKDTEPPFFHELSRAVFARHPDGAAMPTATFDALDYFNNEWKHMPERQKGGVISFVTQLLDELCTEPFNQMLAGHSTLTMADILDQGKILYVDLPTASRPRMARLITAAIKLNFQREVLRRVRKPRPSFLLADEFHLHWSTGANQSDAEFFSLSRESNHANIVAAQNVSSFTKKVTNKDEARNFFGNCAVKIFLRNSEVETNNWASQLFGERQEITVSSNEKASLDHPVTRGTTSYTRSPATMRVVPPEVCTRLSIPMRDKPAHQYAEAIVHLASRETTQKLELTWRVNPVVGPTGETSA